MEKLTRPDLAILFTLPNTLKLFGFSIFFDLECTWWRLCQKRAVCA